MFIWSIKQQKLHLLFLLVEKLNIVDFSSRQKNAYEVWVQKCIISGGFFLFYLKQSVKIKLSLKEISFSQYN